jgi:lipopolysaccharide biosynthesis protein
MINRLAIFVSYSDRSDISPHVLYHVERLRDACSDVHFVSNSPLSPASHDALKRHCGEVIERPNVGFDFAAWRDAIARLEPGRFDEIVLVNSSVVGPLFSLSAVFDTMGTRHCNFWGMTRNRAMKPHIQSYFLCFRRKVIESPAWRSFWNQVEDEAQKSQVIMKYEVELMAFFEKAGFVSDTLIPQMDKHGLERLFLRRLSSHLPIFLPMDKNRTSSTIHSPLELIEQGMPYLKASLLWGHNKYQPFPLEEIMALPNVDFDWSLIGLERKL